jgi:arylformamidase
VSVQEKARREIIAMKEAAADSDADPIFQYMTGQMHPTQPPLLASYEEESARAVEALRPLLDVRYGPHPRQCFDFFAAAAPIGTLAYFHAGYWQSRDKAQFRFLAPSFVAAGVNVALVNYPLCPDVTLAALTEACRAAVPAILVQAKTGALVAAGHSAGGHLAVELALTDWSARGLPENVIAGIAALSGVYDLAPLCATPLNDKLRLDLPAAQASSPIHRARGGMPRALFAVGGLETDGFQRQTSDMLMAWQKAGNTGHAVTVDGCDHFSLLRSLQKPDGILFKAVKALF